MHSTAAIRKQGFRRWYDRALIRSHGHLVTAFLGLILTLAGVEMLGTRVGAGSALWGAGLCAAGVALVLFGLRRYHSIMLLAERLASGATCPSCATYASFDVIAADSQPEHEPEDGAAVWMKVRCRRCRHEWTI